MTTADRHQSIIATESWHANLQLLFHLLRFSNLLLVVLGEPASGKSALKSLFLQEANADLRIQEIEVGAVAHPTELPAQIALQFDLNDDPIKTLSERIKSIQSQISQQQKTAVLVVDDVDAWSPEILATLFDCVSANSKGSGLHCLILGDSCQLRSNLASNLVEKYLDSHAHLLHLDPLSREELDDFVEQFCQLHKISQYSLQERLNLDQLMNQTKGYPGAIIDALSEFITEDEPAFGEPDMNLDDIREAKVAITGRLAAIVSKLPIHWAIGVGACVVLVASVSFSLLLEQSKKTTTHIEIAEAAKESQEALPFTENVNSSALALLRNSSLNQTISKLDAREPHAITIAKATNLKQPKVAEIKKEAVNKQEIQKEVQIQAKPPLKNMAAAIAVTKEKIQIKEQAKRVQQPKLTKQAAVVNNSLGNLSVAEQKILSMNSKHFTLQLLGVSREKSLVNFVKKNKLGNGPMTAHTTRNGKDWYVLLYGEFSNHQQALNEVKRLPKSLQDLKPWPRKVADVQNSIREQIK